MVTLGLRKLRADRKEDASDAVSGQMIKETFDGPSTNRDRTGRVYPVNTQTMTEKGSKKLRKLLLQEKRKPSAFDEYHHGPALYVQGGQGLDMNPMRGTPHNNTMVGNHRQANPTIYNETAFPPVDGLWGWINHIDQAADDPTITSRVKDIFVLADNFVDNFYVDRPYRGGIPDQALGKINRSPIFSSISELQATLSRARCQTTLIKHSLVALLLDLISFATSIAQKSLLPQEFRNYTILATAKTQSTSSNNTIQNLQAALSTYRILSAYIRSDVLEDGNYLQERQHTIQRFTKDFDRAFRYWATEERSQSDLQTALANLMEKTGNLGVLLFSQPSVFYFDWQVRPQDRLKQSIPIWPRLLRVFDADAKYQEFSDHMIPMQQGAVFDDVFGMPEAPIQRKLPGSGIGRSAVPKQTITSGDKSVIPQHNQSTPAAQSVKQIPRKSPARSTYNETPSKVTRPSHPTSSAQKEESTRSGQPTNSSYFRNRQGLQLLSRSVQGNGGSRNDSLLTPKDPSQNAHDLRRPSAAKMAQEAAEDSDLSTDLSERVGETNNDQSDRKRSDEIYSNPGYRSIGNHGLDTQSPDIPLEQDKFFSNSDRKPGYTINHEDKHPTMSDADIRPPADDPETASKGDDSMVRSSRNDYRHRSNVLGRIPPNLPKEQRAKNSSSFGQMEANSYQFRGTTSRAISRGQTQLQSHHNPGIRPRGQDQKHLQSSQIHRQPATTLPLQTPTKAWMRTATAIADDQEVHRPTHPSPSDFPTRKKSPIQKPYQPPPSSYHNSGRNTDTKENWYTTDDDTGDENDISHHYEYISDRSQPVSNPSPSQMYMGNSVRGRSGRRRKYRRDKSDAVAEADSREVRKDRYESESERERRVEDAKEKTKRSPSISSVKRLIKRFEKGIGQ